MYKSLILVLLLTIPALQQDVLDGDDPLANVKDSQQQLKRKPN